VESKKESEQKT